MSRVEIETAHARCLQKQRKQFSEPSNVKAQLCWKKREMVLSWLELGGAGSWRDQFRTPEVTTKFDLLQDEHTLVTGQSGEEVVENS
jgi:hypothetical protein